MKSSQSNFNLGSPGSYLARSYLIATVPVVLEVPKSDEKVFNWSGVHSERSDF